MPLQYSISLNKASQIWEPFLRFNYFLFSASFAQAPKTNLNINGDLGPLGAFISKVFLQRQAYNFEEFGNSLILDSATVKDGKYSFHFFQEEPTWSMLQVRYDAKALKAKNLKKPSFREQYYWTGIWLWCSWNTYNGYYF